jgi:hypothetical protein
MAEKAVIASVDFGYKKIEGLMLPDGTYAVAVPQIADLISASRNTMSRDLKRLLGDGFSPSKQSIMDVKQKINVVKITELMTILNKVAFAGNIQAQELLLAFAEETIERRFNNAFGIKCTEDEYNEKLTIRLKRLLARKDYTDVLMERHIDLYETKPVPEDYRVWTVKVNKALFGCQHFKCNRDSMTTEQQEMITDFERTVKRFALKYDHATPMELIDKTLETF